MTNRVAEKGLRLLLAVWLLAATVFTPSTIIHAHAGGGNPHDHPPADPGHHRDTSHHGPHATPDHHDHHSHHSHHVTSAGGDRHGHVRFAPLKSRPFSPDSRQSDQSEEELSGDRQCILAVRLSGNSHSFSGGLLLLISKLPSVADHRSDSGPIVRCGARPCMVGAPPPLCEIARHERSGVLLV